MKSLCDALYAYEINNFLVFNVAAGFESHPHRHFGIVWSLCVIGSSCKLSFLQGAVLLGLAVL